MIPATDLTPVKYRDASKMESKYISPQTNLMKEWGPNIWMVNENEKRLVVIALSDGGGAWVWFSSPQRFMEWSRELDDEIRVRCGRITHMIVGPNRHVRAFPRNALLTWSQQNPQAKLHIPPGLHIPQDNNNVLVTDFVLTDTPKLDYAMDIDQVVFRSISNNKNKIHDDEVVFYHRASQTILFGDLMHRATNDNNMDDDDDEEEEYEERTPDGSWFSSWTYTIKSYMFWDNDNLPVDQDIQEILDDSAPLVAPKALSKVLNQWKPQKLIVSSGPCHSEGVIDMIRDALSPLFAPNDDNSNSNQEQRQEEKKVNSW